MTPPQRRTTGQSSEPSGNEQTTAPELTDTERNAIRAAVRTWADATPSAVQRLFPTPHNPENVVCICDWCRGREWDYS